MTNDYPALCVSNSFMQNPSENKSYEMGTKESKDF